MDILYDSIRHFVQQMVQGGLLPSSLQYTFMLNALMAGLIIGPLLGMVGTAVVAKRMAFFSTAIGNSALTGIAIGIYIDQVQGNPFSHPYVTLFAFAILFAIFLNFTKNRSAMSNDTLIGVFLAASLAVGSTLMLSVTRTVNIHILDKYLFGDILAAESSDITVLLVVAVITIGTILYSFNNIIIGGLNPALARVRKVPVMKLDYLFVILIALITVASVKIVGSVLVEALLVIPAAAARNISRSLKTFMIYSIIIATFSTVMGIFIPMQYNLKIPSGGAIIIIATLIFITTLFIRMIRKES